MADERNSRILIVEDQAAISILVEDLLVDSGYDVAGTAASMDQALDIARNSVVDGAVLDIQLGDTPVYPLADLLHSIGVPFIFSTGYQGTTIPERFKGVPVVVKPYGSEAFVGALQAALQAAAKPPKPRASVA